KHAPVRRRPRAIRRMDPCVCRVAHSRIGGGEGTLPRRRSSRALCAADAISTPEEQAAAMQISVDAPPRARSAATIEPGISPGARPRAAGKLLALGEQTLYLRGVTYGTFRPAPDGSDYPDSCQVDQDFATMAAHGINAVRTYTVPPRALLDAAAR